RSNFTSQNLSLPSSMAKSKRMSPHRTRTAAGKIKFDHRLVLANWMLDLFHVATFEDLAKHLLDPDSEGFNEDGISRFHQCLKLLLNRPELSNDILLAYDGNIVWHWKRITSRRNADGQNLHPKYFQYLCLLFTEIYLDRYFRNTEKLLADLNAYAKRFNEGDTLQQKMLGQLFTTGLPTAVRIKPYEPEDLKKLAFWSATESGKTLEKTPEKILALLFLNPQLTISELAQRINRSNSAIERAIRKLQKSGRLKRIGPDKGGHWQVVGEDEEQGRIEGGFGPAQQSRPTALK
ncbi:MAG: winged helix-turn-helix transcriptional regulator, partial [Candidatus Auribacterota bacterium]|nr:winged helix-turn-helix transcriptional regulator [Candidatus Auribacterota bacterium]